VWADTLFRAEQQHALRILIWAASSIIAGVALVLFTARKRSDSPLLRYFGYQMLAWAVLDAAIGALAWRGLAMRDLAAATRLQRTLWVALGLEAVVIATGLALAVSAWFQGRRMGGVGSGIGLIIQGLALLILDLDLLSRIAIR